MVAVSEFVPWTDGFHGQVTVLAMVERFLQPGMGFPFARKETLPSIFAVATIFVKER